MGGRVQLALIAQKENPNLTHYILKTTKKPQNRLGDEVFYETVKIRVVTASGVTPLDA